MYHESEIHGNGCMPCIWCYFWTKMPFVLHNWWIVDSWIIMNALYLMEVWSYDTYMFCMFHGLRIHEKDTRHVFDDNNDLWYNDCMSRISPWWFWWNFLGKVLSFVVALERVAYCCCIAGGAYWYCREPCVGAMVCWCWLFEMISKRGPDIPWVKVPKVIEKTKREVWYSLGEIP